MSRKEGVDTSGTFRGIVAAASSEKVTCQSHVMPRAGRPLPMELVQIWPSLVYA